MFLTVFFLSSQLFRDLLEMKNTIIVDHIKQIRFVKTIVTKINCYMVETISFLLQINVNFVTMQLQFKVM